MTDNFKNNDQLLFTCSSVNILVFNENTIHISSNISSNISNSSIFISCKLYNSGLVLHPTILDVNINSFDMIVSNKDFNGTGAMEGITVIFDYMVFFNPSQLNYLVNDDKQLIYSGNVDMGSGTHGISRFFDASDYSEYKCFVMPYLKKKNPLKSIDNIALYIEKKDWENYPGFYAYGHYKDGGGQKDGGNVYNDYFFWIAIHDDIINYKKDDKPIIKLGQGQTFNGSVTITHNLNTSNYFILLTPIRPSNHINNFYYNLQYNNKTATSFTVISFERDGSNGEHGGYNNKSHPFNWAVIRNN